MEVAENTFIDFGTSTIEKKSTRPRVSIKKLDRLANPETLVSQDSKDFNYEVDKVAFIDHMNFLRDQSVEESVLYKKYHEIRSYTRDAGFIHDTARVKPKIWNPWPTNGDPHWTDEEIISKIENLKPRLKLVIGDGESSKDWLTLRVLCHSMNFDQSPGRFLRFLVVDEYTDKYIGAVSLASDVISIGARDDYIGWTADQKLIDKKLRHSVIGSCIMATQPFGYNFLGGKLVASLLTTKHVRDAWEAAYKDKVVGFTTTSLYGTCSMYNGIPYWHKCGATKGMISLKPDDKPHYEKWHEYIKQNRTEEYERRMNQDEDVSGPVTGAKQRIIQMIFNELGLKNKDYVHGFERGVYYAGIYENFKEFYQNKITEDQLVMKPKFAKDVDGVLEWWKPKAITRFKNLSSEGRLKKEILYYGNLLKDKYKDYATAKAEYFNNVGR